MSELKRYWIYKGTSNFCQNLTLDDDCETMVRQKPDGFYDIVSTNDTVEGGVEVVLASDYEKLKAQLERAEEALRKTINVADFFSRHADCRRDTWACKCEFCRDTTSTKNLRDAREYFKEKEQV